MYIFAFRQRIEFTMSYYPTKKKNAPWFQYPVAKLVFRLLMVLLLFSLSRWLIYLFNTEFFHHLTLAQSFRLFLVGMRFDLVVIAYANIPMILLYCLPAKFIFNQVLQKIINVLFVLVNSVLITLNMLDVIYFRFLGKRMTTELSQFFGASDESMFSLLGQITVDYWYMLVLAVLFVIVLAVVGKRTKLVQQTEVITNRWYFLQWISLMVFSVLTPVACRGGVQSKPVNMATALKYADSQNMPIVLNAPFSIVKSSINHTLSEIHDFEPEEMDFSPIHYSLKSNRFVTEDPGYLPNLVFLVLESYGQEMVSYYNPDCRFHLTPFTDSLLTQSLTFNGRANGRRSNEALPSLLSGLPPLMDVDFSSSAYSENRIDGLGLVLRQLGYSTSMFHGGSNGTMNFDTYAKKAGFDYYYGRNEYNNDADYDGRCGIYDGPFLQYSLATIDTFSKPFATLIHTLSSQHPYTLPKSFELPEENYLWSGFEKTVYYTDCALRDFFDEASQKPWFDSTLFVITADHANTEHYLSAYSNIWGMYSIPIAFFMPSRIPAGKCEEIAQQADLNVSILSAMGIEDTVFSFGRNVFDSLSDPSFIAYINQTYQYSNGQYLVQSDGNQTIGVFNVIRDRQLNDNLIDRIQCSDLSKKLKERIQEYNNRFIFNDLYYNKEALHEQAEDTVHHQSDIRQETPEKPGESN